MATSGLTKVGIGVETSGWALPANTGVTPAFILPVNTVTVSTPFEQILDNTKRGVWAKDFGAYQGPGKVEMSLEGPFYPEVCGFFLALMLGASAAPTGSAPFYHAITPANTVPTASTQRSLSVQVEDGVNSSRYIGMVVTTLALKYSAAEGVLSYTATLAGQQQLLSQSAMGTTLNLSPSSHLNPFLGWHAQVLTAGVNARVIEGEVTFERESFVRYSASQSKYPADIQLGGLSVMQRATLDYYQVADYNLYFNKTQQDFTVDFDFSPPGYGYQKNLTITCSKVDFGEGAAEIDRSGINMTLALSLRALANSTDGSLAVPAPCRIALSNDYASQYIT
jgi:hypothetical protein